MPGCCVVPTKGLFLTLSVFYQDWLLGTEQHAVLGTPRPGALEVIKDSYTGVSICAFQQKLLRGSWYQHRGSG